MPETSISLFDLLSSKKMTSKIKKISRVEIDNEVSKHGKKFDKEMSELGKRILSIEKMDVDTMVNKAISKTEDEIRKLIRDEVARIFFTLFVKRNTWK